MWLPPEVTVAATGDVFDLDTVKKFLRVDTDAEDTDIAQIAADACAQIETLAGIRFLTQTVVLRAARFEDLAHFDTGPVRSVASVKYLDPNGVEQTLDPSKWERFGAGLDQGVRYTVGSLWPSARAVPDAIRVTADIGYGADSTAMPPPLRRAAFLLIGDWYENREDTIAERSVTPQQIPNGVQALINNFRP